MLKVFWLRRSKSLLCLGMSTLNILCRPCCHAWYKAFGSLVALWTKSWRSLLHKQERKNITNCLKHSSWYVCLSNIFWSSIFAKHMLNCRFFSVDAYMSCRFAECHQQPWQESCLSQTMRLPQQSRPSWEERRCSSCAVHLVKKRPCRPFWKQLGPISPTVTGFLSNNFGKRVVGSEKFHETNPWKTWILIWFAWFSKKELIDTKSPHHKRGVFGSRDGSRDGVFLDRFDVLPWGQRLLSLTGRRGRGKSTVAALGMVAALQRQRCVVVTGPGSNSD